MGLRAFAYAAYFGIYGPLFAVVAIIVGRLTYDFVQRPEPWDLILAIPALLPATLMMYAFGLIIGILPGVATGLIYWWLRGRPAVARLSSRVRAAGMSFVGGLVCVLLALIVGAAPSDLLSKESVLVFVIPGMVAASLCTILVDRQIRRQSAEKSLGENAT